jgi:pyruvate kinase
MAAVPVFLQSQVLECMVSKDFKLLATQSQDISSSVLDGVDVFILSHETSVGRFAVEATVLLAKAIAEAENVYDHEQTF